MPVWPRCTKSGIDPGFSQRLVERQRGIFFADGAIGADRQHTLAGALDAGADG